MQNTKYMKRLKNSAGSVAPSSRLEVRYASFDFSPLRQVQDRGVSDQQLGCLVGCFAEGTWLAAVQGVLLGPRKAGPKSQYQRSTFNQGSSEAPRVCVYQKSEVPKPQHGVSGLSRALCMIRAADRRTDVSRR